MGLMWSVPMFKNAPTSKVIPRTRPTLSACEETSITRWEMPESYAF